MDLTEKKKIVHKLSQLLSYFNMAPLFLMCTKLYLWDIQCNSAYLKLWPSRKKHFLA